jgi:F-type H+-transporting ATPase subunit delta
MMHSASRAASAALRPHKRAVMDPLTGSGELISLADELYAVADLLVAQPRLRRSLGDPATDAEGRAALVGNLLAGKVGPGTIEIAKAAVSQRWSSPWDLADALETSGDDALFAAAERDDQLEDVVDELFRFERILDASSELTTLLDEAPIDPARRVALLDDVLARKVRPTTKALLEQAVRSQRKRSITLAIDALLEEAAARQHQSMARVISAVDLTRDQCHRLTTALSERYGRPISVRTAVVPAVRGGLVIRVGDEVIDASVASRLISAGIQFAEKASRADITTRTRQGNN